MKIAYVTTYDATDVRNWSGLGTYIAHTLQDNLTSLQYVSPLEEKAPFLLKAKRRFYTRLLKKSYLLERDPSVLKSYAKQVVNKLGSSNSDIIFSPGTIPIAYLDCHQPIVFWTDATFGGMIDFYPEFSNLCQESIKHGNQMEKSALNRCKLAIYSSDWAAQTAIELYQINPSKVRVVPFGANLQSDRSLEDIKALIDLRPTTTCKLLFLSGNWQRKGGNIALEVARELNRAGLRTELTIVGCTPSIGEFPPNCVKAIPFIDKNDIKGVEQINQLIGESHFLILPSLADCTPVVFSEANSFGVPCLSTNVGGITTIIKDNVNGRTFSRNAAISEYCDYITNLFSSYTQYKSLAISSFHEYQNRLNWKVAGQTVKNLLHELV